ncbi:hypothetical protein [Nocardia terpenica]|uniref:hypothetical protein n=1 Tax=Nocardia terpenica TaxID=455432 RepID=UPI001E4170C1|nr:hypothetical protein [Nocardia terpenica]MBF6151016.1 hypothetical protein [Nocardia terpenica]
MMDLFGNIGWRKIRIPTNSSGRRCDADGLFKKLTIAFVDYLKNPLSKLAGQLR